MRQDKTKDLKSWCLCGFLLAMIVPSAYAGGPRFVTGTTYTASGSGVPMAFYTSSLTYYTDPGDLNAAVSHAQADAMVAAAAATWNVPSSSLVLTKGGSLQEHVSGANTDFDGSEVVFPADVAASNWRNIPIAVIYDTDGSVIDTLLGQGASDPSGCRDTGVLESVDSFGDEGTIQHAMLVLNGRCVGSAPQQLLQMQYQLERAFGRVLGLAWSQLNDNLFTGATPPTPGEIANWPIMHPIDVLCGLYSYQCITNPFQLRPDDLSALALLYPVTPSNITVGKVQSGQQAVYLTGSLVFPTGQGMDWMNVTVTREAENHWQRETWETASAVVGTTYQQNIGNPVSGPESREENVGTPWSPDEGQFVIQRVPNDSVETLFITTEPIDPLYTGEYALAPYQRPPVTPSGSPQTMIASSAPAGTAGFFYSTNVANAAASCLTGADGTQAQPAEEDASGWWTGLLCSVGHSSWWSVPIKAGRSWTVEVTALDETGAPTTSKAQPVLGVWKQGDSGLPTVASAPVAMNAWALGVTQLQLPASDSAQTYMFAVADQFGGGRPDFPYEARVLYAQDVAPTVLAMTGGEITITGQGFQPGNAVIVNGVAAQVVSLTATQIIARMPDAVTAGASLGMPVDVSVTDPATGGATTISGALRYVEEESDAIALVSAPASLETGLASSTPFEVRVSLPDGTTPAVGASVRLSVSSGAASLDACGGASVCTVQTDSAGLVSTTVTGESAGTVTLVATVVSGGSSVQATMADADPQRAVTLASSSSYVAAGASPSWTISLTATQDGIAKAGVLITWSAGEGLSLSSGAATTDASGAATVTIHASGPLSAGAQTVTACGWTSICKSWTVYVVPASQWVVTVLSGGDQTVSAGSAFSPVALQVTDAAGHPLEGAVVSIYQTVDAWEGECSLSGRCAASPVLASSKSSAVSDANGMLTATPLEVAGISERVNIAAVTGTQGFVTTTLTKIPNASS